MVQGKKESYAECFLFCLLNNTWFPPYLTQFFIEKIKLTILIWGEFEKDMVLKHRNTFVRLEIYCYNYKYYLLLTVIIRTRNKEISRPYRYIPNRSDFQALEDCWKGVRWIRDVLSTSRLKTQAGISVQEQRIIYVLHESVQLL